MLHTPRQGQLVAGASIAVLAAVVPAGVAQAAPVAADAPTVSAAAKATCDPLIDFGQEGFGHPTSIDNKYLPMVPGTRLTYRGDVSGSGPHEVVFTVTDLTKVIDGVDTRVIYDVDKNGSEVAEAELAFFAQSDKGTVWNLGEYPEEYDKGKFTGAPSVWISGRDGAKAGIHMLADPTDPANRHREYRQGVAPKIDFLDCAEVDRTGGHVKVPAGDFGDVLTTHETSPLESKTATQVKQHAPGVGIVRISAINDPQAETLRLTEIAHLGQSDLAAVDDQAIALDKHGHKVSSVYRTTPPVRQDGS